MLALSEAQVKNFVQLCAKRYDSKRMDPGSVENGCQAVSPVHPACSLGLGCRTLSQAPLWARLGRRASASRALR